MLNFDITNISAAFIERHKTHGFEDPQLVELMTAFKSEHIPTTVLYVKCSNRNTYIYGFIKEEAYRNILHEDTSSLKRTLLDIVENNENIEPDNIYNKCGIRFYFQRYIES